MRKKVKRKFYRLNWKITAPKLRVIDKEGKQIGVLTRDKALKLAQEKRIDLVEIAPQASPPVCKLIDFRKFLYLEKKKRRERKKGSRGGKEIRLRPFIGDHDYQVRLSQAKDFLNGGEKVKIRVRFFGREIVKKKFGFELINRFLLDLGENVRLEREPHFIGKTLVAQLAPVRSYGKKEGKNQKNSPKEVQNNQNGQGPLPRSDDQALKGQKKKVPGSAPKSA